ncbi:MAG: cyclic nucleotide-binding domain-containing protein [Deltaproteobacteria bacterium]|nr:cyclic nucleotide-binding domain-containing protein [Deltaproteobacteria bacterium]
MAKDGRALREEAAAATADGKYKRALAAYLELERIEPRDAQWPKRAAEMYRKLGNIKLAVSAFERSADRYAQNGFLVQAIAVCKLILQIDPQHEGILGRLAQMNEQLGQGPTRAQGFAENNPALHQSPNVQMIRRSASGTEVPLARSGPLTRPPKPATVPPKAEPVLPRPAPPPPRPATAPPVIEPPMPAEPFSRRIKADSAPQVTVPRTKSKPIQMPPGAALESVNLSEAVKDSYEHSSPGVYVIPIDDEPELDAMVRPSFPVIEIESPDSEEIDADPDELMELALDDIEEVPLAEPRAMGVAAQRALAATPLFAGLPSEALESLVEHLTLVSLDVGVALFHEGDPGDALYVIVEGEVAVQAEGPPRVEMARLGPGAFIGEVALMTDQPRSATVSATVPSELIRIDRHTLSRVLANHGDVLKAVLRFVRERLVDRWIRTSPLFRPFDDAQRDELAARFKFLEIDSDTVLLSAGTKPDGLYIVLAGHCQVKRDGVTIATLGPGDLIGETALLSGGTLRSDVIARGKSLALCLPASEFREMIMTHPHVLEYIGEQAEHSRRLQIL